jgi:hypothetical protein
MVITNSLDPQTCPHRLELIHLALHLVGLLFPARAVDSHHLEDPEVEHPAGALVSIFRMKPGKASKLIKADLTLALK